MVVGYYGFLVGDFYKFVTRLISIYTENKE